MDDDEYLANLQALPSQDVMQQMMDAPRHYGGEVEIARTADFVISMAPQIFNWRLFIAIPENFGYGYKHGYCYFGTGLISAIKAFQAGLDWAQTEDPFAVDPQNFDKKAF